MIGIVMLMIGLGKASLEEQEKERTKREAKRNGKKYYSYYGHDYSIENDEPLTFNGGVLREARTGKIVWSPFNDKLERANKICRENRKRYHYEENWGGIHDDNGFIRIDNETGMAFKYYRSFGRSIYEPCYCFYYIDRITGEKIGETKYLTVEEIHKYQ